MRRFKKAAKARSARAEQFDGRGAVADLPEVNLNFAQIRKPLVEPGTVTEAEQLKGVTEALGLERKR